MSLLKSDAVRPGDDLRPCVMKLVRDPVLKKVGLRRGGLRAWPELTCRRAGRYSMA